MIRRTVASTVLVSLLMTSANVFAYAPADALPFAAPSCRGEAPPRFIQLADTGAPMFGELDSRPISNSARRLADAAARVQIGQPVSAVPQKSDGAAHALIATGAVAAFLGVLFYEGSRNSCADPTKQADCDMYRQWGAISLVGGSGLLIWGIAKMVK